MAAMGDKDKKVIDEFEAALLRIMAVERMDCSILLNHILELKNQMIELQSRKTYAIQEADMIQEIESVRNLPEIRKDSTKEEILELTYAKLYHRLYRDTFQKAAFNVQMQAAVHDSLQKMNMDENMDVSSEMQKLLEHHSNNFHTSKELLSLVDRKEKLETDILSVKLKYADYLGDIKKKWEVYEGKAVSSEDMEDEDIANYNRRIEMRQEKLIIITHILQNVIGTSGKLWGADEYYVQILLLCDCTVRDASRSEVDTILAKITRHSEAREKRPQPSKGKRDVRVVSMQVSKPVRL